MSSDFSIRDLFLLTPWTDTFFACKNIKKLTENYQSDQLIYPLTISTYVKGPWVECDADIQLPENMIRYLHLNLSVISPVDCIS